MTFPAGSIPGADEWEDAIAPAFTTYVPTLTATTTNPTLGTGATQTGRYRAHGNLVFMEVGITFGTGATAGSGFYHIDLPLPALSGSVAIGTVWLYDSSTGDQRAGLCRLFGTSTIEMLVTVSSVVVSNSGPWTWAVGDQILTSLTYESA